MHLQLSPLHSDPVHIGTESGLSLWRVWTIDPAFIARPDGSARLESGWYRARTTLDKRGGEIRQPRLYLPDVQGHYSESRTVDLSRDGGAYEAEFFLPHSTDHVRFDPSTERCEFACAGLELSPISAPPMGVIKARVAESVKEAAPVLRKIAQRLGLGQAEAPPFASPPAQRPGILDEYVRTLPSHQNASDLFKGNWWSAFPPSFGATAGKVPHFQDSRITWAMEHLGGVAGRKLLELGPMEGGHTYMLEQAGAASILAIEASPRAYLKCLVSKEVAGMKRASFLLGDFEEFLRHSNERFDAVIACGVIYHLKNPVEMIHNLARFTDRVYVWTQYFDRARIDAIPHMQRRFPGSHPAEHAGFRYIANRYEYGDFLDTTRFAGGSDEYSHWLTREDLLGALRHAGFTEIEIGEDDAGHVNGPCISLVARRKP